MFAYRAKGVVNRCEEGLAGLAGGGSVGETWRRLLPRGTGLEGSQQAANCLSPNSRGVAGQISTLSCFFRRLAVSARKRVNVCYNERDRIARRKPMSKKTPGTIDLRSKRPYTAPSFRREQIFETTALACGKCTTGPYPQFQCGALLKSS